MDPLLRGFLFGIHGILQWWVSQFNYVLHEYPFPVCLKFSVSSFHDPTSYVTTKKTIVTSFSLPPRNTWFYAFLLYLTFSWVFSAPSWVIKFDYPPLHILSSTLICFFNLMISLPFLKWAIPQGHCFTPLLQWITYMSFTFVVQHGASSSTANM